MTTTVKRGAGRPAAQEKSNRHAQRTQLPPKPGQVQDARDAIAEATKGYGEMNVEQLKEVARGLGVKPLPKTKGPLLNAILEAETAKRKEARAEAKVDATLSQPASDAKIEAAFAEAEDEAEPYDPSQPTNAEDLLPETKSTAKAKAFLAEAHGLGWRGNATSDGEQTIATVTRDAETITIEWVRGVFQDNCTYAHSGRTPIKLRNASAAKQRMSIPPAKANEEAAKVTAHKSVRPKAAKAGSVAPSLPFDPALATDEEVLSAVQGCKIAWRNSVTGEIESTYVPDAREASRRGTGAKPAVTMREDKSGRSINFLDGSGYRAVRVSSLVSVRRMQGR